MWTTVAFSIFLAMIFIQTAPSEGNGSFPSTLHHRFSKFKSDVHRILEGERIRKKRQLTDSDPLDYKLKFSSATPGDLPYLSDYNLTFWIHVKEKTKNQILIGTTGGHILLFEMADDDDKAALTVALSEVSDVAIKAKAFNHYDEQWFAVLHYSGREYYIIMYQRIGRGLEKKQRIDLTGSADMELVTMKGIHYLVVATYSTTTEQSFSYQAFITLYQWSLTQLDPIATRMAYGARSVVCWSLDGSLYIALAQETDDEGNLKIGSPIYLYNSKEENKLVLWQMLDTFGPTKVRHFYVAGNHYVIVISRRDAVIYWWSSGQFLEWQSLMGTADASDVSVILLGNGEVAIVIALKEEALFYTLDSSGLYVITLRMTLKGSDLLALQFVFSGRAYYALALFAESQPHSIWKMTIASHYMPSVSSLDPLLQCLLSTRELLKERQTELDSIKKDLSRVWLKGSNQNITSKVTVKGNIKSNQRLNVRDVIIVKYTKVPDASMSHVIAELVNMNDTADIVNHQLGGVVFKSTRQELRGHKHFEDAVFVPSLTMEATDSDVSVNGVKISRLQSQGLRKIGDQVFSAPTLVSNIYAERANVASINGILTDDYLMLYGNQVVTGNLDFSDVFASSLFVGTINTIPVEDIITTNSPQSIKELKSFSLLKSNTIDVLGETNEVDLSGISHKIATVDDYNEFKGKLTFLKPVTVKGDVFLTGKINNVVNISRLVHQSVNRDFQQDLTGRYTFKTKQTIAGDLLIDGFINSVSVNNLLTVSSDQVVYADTVFSAPLTIKRDLIVDSINGLDLSEEAVRKVPTYQFINGRKAFTQDVTADFVDMTEYITLDGVDPSLLVQDIVQHKEGHVAQNRTVLKNVNVLGNLTLNDTSGFEILTAESWAWLKSIKQEISTPVTATYLSFENDLDVQTLNGLDLLLDLVNTFTDEVIESSKTFIKTISKSLETKDGTINGVNLTSFKIELENYRNDGTVQGTKTIDSLEIQGNVHVTLLNNLEIMHPVAFQVVNGPVEFLGEITSVQGNVRAGSISFGIFNGENLQDYFRNAVTSSYGSRPLLNKNFGHLKAANLLLLPGSKVSGVSLDELQQRVVTLNTPQLITAPKLFALSLNFSKIMSVSTLNGIDLSNYIGEVVLTDEVARITNKQFLSDFRTTSAFVRGTINGVKIADLAENVFYKSDNNIVTQPFVFEGDIDVEDLYAPVLDGVEWKDMVFLKNDEVLETGWFLSNTYVNGDIFVTGLVNGCDLSEISSSLYTNKSGQIVKKNVNVHSIFVVGNLIVKNRINKIPVGALENLITASDDQVITSNAIIEAKLIVERLNLTERAKSDLELIVKDAVRHSIMQEITGLKTFKGGVDAIVLSGGDVFATRVNGINLEELDLTTVWKNGHQEISGDKIFESLFTNVAVINGYINGLKLPNDVVRTDVSEHILYPTYFMSDVYIPTELFVHGRVDGVNLEELIFQRVTVSADQNITAELIFHDDTVIYDKLTIEGTVNEIVLDLVAKIKSAYPLHGYKIFVELFVSGPVTASLVNGYDVATLARNILRYNQEDYVNGVQIFEKPMLAQRSLYAEWINNIPIRHLAEVFTSMMEGLKSTMGYLEDLSSSLQRKLNNQMSATQDKTLKFSHFILFQEIDMGPTSRILYGYSLDLPDSEFSHSLVMWTTQKQCVFMENCCHLDFSYWLQVKKNGVLMADSAAESGRFYPISDSAPVVGNKEFFIWTNATDVRPKWCSVKNTRMVLASNYGGLSQVFIDSKDTSFLSDVKSFRKVHLYAVAAFYFDPQNEEYGNTIVYVYDEKHRWNEHQVLPSFGVLSLDIINYIQGYREDVLLALGTGMNTEPPSYSTIYKWNNNDRAFDLLQNIPSRFVTSTLWIRRGKDLLLSLAQVTNWPDRLTDCSELVAGGQIDIYHYEDYLKWIQSIPIEGVESMVSFSVDDDTYLAAASSKHQTVYIFEWRGHAGFVEIQSISTDVRHLNIYEIDEDVYMTVASISGPSKILKMMRRGKQSETRKYFDVMFPEQRDEGRKESKCN